MGCGQGEGETDLTPRVVFEKKTPLPRMLDLATKSSPTFPIFGVQA